MTPRKPGSKYPRWAMLIVALLLPAASLLPFGSLWLWQHGYILHWAVGVCIVVVAVYHLQQKLIDPVAAPAAADDADPDPGDPGWTPRQAQAWDDVMRFASQVTPERMTSRDAVLGLGRETIEVVAKRLHPERADPLLQFTLPEALSVIERASVNLRRFVVTSFPLGDRITVAQFMWLYRWRGALELVEKGYDLWRVVRLLNPVAAVTQELRERFTRQIYEMGREHLARRIARAFVKEVGRAAIDLYGGNLRVAPEQLQAHVTAASRQDLAAAEARAGEPVRILVAGQVGAGKSSLINALANAVEAVVDTLPATARFTRSQAHSRRFAGSAHHRQPGARRQRTPARPDRGCKRLRHDLVGDVGGAGRAADRCRRTGGNSPAFPHASQPPPPADAARFSRTSTNCVRSMNGSRPTISPRRRVPRRSPSVARSKRPVPNSALPPTRSCPCASISRWRPTTSTPCG